jgi:beta-phosphoglucomutase-like phosphatase (HAD superfamily)
MAVRALLFDFDGTLVDTEAAAYRSWQEVFVERGHELALDRWVAAVGTLDGFDPLDELERLSGTAVDRETLTARQLRRERELGDLELLRAGVSDYLSGARGLGLRVGIVTSSSTHWVERHLQRLGAAGGWSCIVAANRDATVAKPRPTLYLQALRQLGVPPDEAVAIEDSPNGVAAATAAGLYTVAVPNGVTAGLDLSRADLVVASLAELPLSELLTLAERRAA